MLTRDYLHCFKRASGSANERASDMGQFIFKVSGSCSIEIIVVEEYIVAKEKDGLLIISAIILCYIFSSFPFM